jgi:hypothetical protein
LRAPDPALAAIGEPGSSATTFESTNNDNACQEFSKMNNELPLTYPFFAASRRRSDQALSGT